jgi:hypothetical protein
MSSFVDTLPPTLKALAECAQSYALKIAFYNLFGNARLLQQLELSNIKFNPANGSTVQVPDTAQSAWLEIVSNIPLAALTIQFPTNSSCNDGQEVLILCNNIVTAITLTAPGATFNTTISSAAANIAYKFKYSKVSNLWYRLQ